MDSILCWPTTSEQETFPGVWLICSSKEGWYSFFQQLHVSNSFLDRVGIHAYILSSMVKLCLAQAQVSVQ